MTSRIQNESVVGRALEVVEIEEASALAASGELSVFTEAEQRYAASKSDPERRLAARLAAKRAMRRLLGDEVPLEEIEVLPARGCPPRISLAGKTAHLLAGTGADRILLSLTHGRTHAAACVLLVREEQ